MSRRAFNDPGEVRSALLGADYVAEEALATAVFLALRLGKPLFLEGEPGVGKTEVAKALARILDEPLVRLQCYEGLDVHQAVYEWNYPRQLLALRAGERRPADADGVSGVEGVFAREFLIERALLRAIDPVATGGRCVLLIDEIDRSDEEFEAYLLEVLAENQITIPELGTIRATMPPVVVVTSNRSREIHDALKRRCLYHWIDFPSFEKEVAIVERRVPEASAELAAQVVALVQELRDEDLFKRPGVAETLDWLNALLALDRETLDDAILERTLGVLLKVQDDLERIDDEAARRLLERSRRVLRR